jgi:hypothetical protein
MRTRVVPDYGRARWNESEMGGDGEGSGDPVQCAVGLWKRGWWPRGIGNGTMGGERERGSQYQFA